jgi:hypothetical protein
MALPSPAHLLPPLFDANIFCGNYPYRRLPADTPEGLSALQTEAFLIGSIATPFESIFYRQPLEGLRPWLDADLPNTWYWLPVNPLMPRWQDDVAFAANNPRIAGLRLLPRYHGYLSDHPALAEVVAVAAELNVPLNLTARLLDDRLHPHPLHVDAPLQMGDMAALLTSASSARFILSMFTMAELAQISDILSANANVFADIGCATPFEFRADYIRATLPLERVIY